MIAEMDIDLIFSLPFVFVLSFLVGSGIYLVGWIVSAKKAKTRGKVAPYASGEDLPPLKFQIDLEKFLIYALYFLIYDIFAFTLAMSLGTPGHLPTVYAIIVLAAVVILAPWRRIK